jgi:TonB-linked SusC/RagA family outer membrane protein
MSLLFTAAFGLLYPTQINAQTLRVSGKVIDEAGNPIIGASIKIAGTTIGIISDSNGSFVLKNVQSNAKLNVSFLGYKSKTIPIQGKTNLTILLEENAQTLDEVIVIGYGTQKRTDLTGSVGQAKMSDLVKAPVATFDQALAGRIAGVNVTSNDGQPGNVGNIVIRGGNSLTQSTAPLYVVDGFLMESLQSAAIDPQDIASISILKDASAVAIYGARGANGVVVIETKKGIVGKPVVTYNGSFGFQKVTKTMDIMNPYEFVKYQDELNPTLANSLYLSNYGLTVDDYKNSKAYDWQSMLFRTAPIQKHNISVRGGNADTKYAVSGSFFDQDGIIINSNYKNYSGRISLDQNINKKVKTGVIIGISNIQANGSQIAAGSTGSTMGYALYQVWGFRPANIANQWVDWSSVFVDPASTSLDFRVNPIQNTKEDLKKKTSDNVNINAYLSYQILKNLTLKISGGFSDLKTKQTFFHNSMTALGTPLNPSNVKGTWGGITQSESKSWLNENTLTYNKKIDTKNSINILGGFTLQKNESSNFGFVSDLIPNEVLGISSLGSGTPYSNSSDLSNNTMVSFLGRVDYNYDEKYLITASIRADGSSKFPSGNRWGFFPSVGLAWRISQETFMRNLTYISNLKMRMGYGITGNNRVSDFGYLPTVTVDNKYAYSFDNATPIKGAVYSSIGNAKLKWESTKQIDLGIDLGVFNNRINLTADVYKKNTYNLLLNAPLPRTTGYTIVMKNIGEIENKGLELTLNTIPVKTNYFTWESDFNISFNVNKVKKLEGKSTMLSTVNWDYNYNSNPLYIARVNGPAALFYGYIYNGNYQYKDFNEVSPGKYVLKGNIPSDGKTRSTIQPGDIKYKDLNGDGVIDSNDLTVIGNPNPIHIGGWGNQISYKNVSLNIFLQWSYGNHVYNANRTIFGGNSLDRPDMNQFAETNNRWTPENQNNMLYRAGGQGPIGWYDSRTIENASYLRIKTVDLEYRFPLKLISKLHLTNLALNISAQNLFTFTDYKGMDPEVSTRNSILTPGFDFSAYPIARTIVCGLRMNF